MHNCIYKVLKRKNNILNINLNKLIKQQNNTNPNYWTAKNNQRVDGIISWSNNFEYITLNNI